MREAVDSFPPSLRAAVWGVSKTIGSSQPLNRNLPSPKFHMLPSFLVSFSSVDETRKNLSNYFFFFVYKKSVEISSLTVISAKFTEPYFGVYSIQKIFALTEKKLITK